MAPCAGCALCWRASYFRYVRIVIPNPFIAIRRVTCAIRPRGATRLLTTFGVSRRCCCSNDVHRRDADARVVTPDGGTDPREGSSGLRCALSPLPSDPDRQSSDAAHVCLLRSPKRKPHSRGLKEYLGELLAPSAMPPTRTALRLAPHSQSRVALLQACQYNMTQPSTADPNIAP
jgi:hypothetical protein